MSSSVDVVMWFIQIKKTKTKAKSASMIYKVRQTRSSRQRGDKSQDEDFIGVRHRRTDNYNGFYMPVNMTQIRSKGNVIFK